MSKFFSLLLALATMGFCLAGPQEDPTSKELGAVKWLRDIDAAKKLSQESGKPLMLLFQEVPG